MNQNFSKSKILHEWPEWEHFQWMEEGGENFRGKNLGDTNFGPLKILDF